MGALDVTAAIAIISSDLKTLRLKQKGVNTKRRPKSFVMAREPVRDFAARKAPYGCRTGTDGNLSV